EEASVAQRRAARIPPRAHTRRAATRGEQAGDRIAGHVEHLRVHRGAQTAERETGCTVAEVERGDRTADGLDPLALLAQHRIAAVLRMPVVDLDGRLQCSG